MKMTDGKKHIEILMIENGHLDWSNDFFESGNLSFHGDEYHVKDVNYCVQQAMDWRNRTGDFADETETSKYDCREVEVYEYRKEEFDIYAFIYEAKRHFEMVGYLVEEHESEDEWHNVEHVLMKFYYNGMINDYTNNFMWEIEYTEDPETGNPEWVIRHASLGNGVEWSEWKHLAWAYIDIVESEVATV